jgi:hypothetical protein
MENGFMDAHHSASTRWVPEPFGPPWLRFWLERHQHPVNYYLHLVGIPMTLLSLLLPSVLGLVFWSWFWLVGSFLLLGAGGYALQFVGHLIEGNDPGEVLVVKRWLGWPEVAIVPRRPAVVAPTPVAQPSLAHQ